MSAHTPGPWYVANGPRYHIRSKEHGQIFPSGADGRLMAAVPDLLAELRLAADTMEAIAIDCKHESARLELEHIAARARDAIAKATEEK